MNRLLMILEIMNAVLCVAAVLPYAAVWHWMAGRMERRGGTFFGVRVDAGFAESAAGKAILKTFRRRVWSWSLAAGISALLSHSPVLRLAVSQIGAYLAGLMAFALAHRQTRRAAPNSPEPSVRVAGLIDEPGSRWLTLLDWLAMAVPFIAPVTTLILLNLYSSQLPQGRNGRLIPVVFGLFVALMCSANQFALRFCSRPSDWASTPGASRKFRTYLGAMQAAALTFAVANLCAMVSMSLNRIVPWMRYWDIEAHFVIALPLYILWLTGIWRLRFWLKAHMATQSADPMPDACWKCGQFYFNRGDPALVVPLRSGVGQSFNYARPSVWIAQTAIILIMIVMFAAMLIR